MSERTARRVATVMLAVMALLLLIGISGLKFVRQPLGYVGEHLQPLLVAHAAGVQSDHLSAGASPLVAQDARPR